MRALRFMSYLNPLGVKPVTIAGNSNPTILDTIRKAWNDSETYEGFARRNEKSGKKAIDDTLAAIRAMRAGERIEVSGHSVPRVGLADVLLEAPAGIVDLVHKSKKGEAPYTFILMSAFEKARQEDLGHLEKQDGLAGRRNVMYRFTRGASPSGVV
jgi:hypothetical protein